MTVADMSVITAEVQVDETDIVNVKLGQPAEVSIDAIPKKKFKGIVTEIGNNAILRSTGVSTSQTLGSSQEAKDFKVVVTLQEPPENLRPGFEFDRQDHDGHSPERRLDSDPGSDHPSAWRSRRQEGQGQDAVQAATPANPEDKTKAKEETPGRFRHSQRKSRI